MFIQHLPLLSSKRIVLASASPRRSELLLDHWTQRKVTVDAEKSDGKKKSDGGRREK
jgi:predicted house-cleaning NTP pyrophosphatase (Maf/HAM1 superfamily)